MPDKYLEGDRIERLEKATERLSQNVIGLSTSLALVSEINERQARLKIRTATAESKAHEVAKTAVNKEDLASEILTVTESNRRWRTVITISIVIILLLLAYVRYESVQQISDRLEGSYEVCKTTDAHLDVEIYLLSQTRPGQPVPPAITKTINDLKSLKKDCDAFFGPENRPDFIQVP